MPAKPTQFDAKHYKSLPTDAARTDYLLDVTEGVRDNLIAGRAIAQNDPSFTPPVGFTTEEWIKTLTDQIDTMANNLAKAGRPQKP